MAIAPLLLHHPLTKLPFRPKSLPLRPVINPYPLSTTTITTKAITFPNPQSPPSSPPPPFKKTFSHIFQQCATGRTLNTGKQAHAHMIASGFVPTTFVANCLIHMYVRCSRLDYARKVFGRMPERDVVSWNALISGYAQGGLLADALALFGEMPERDVVSWNSMMSGCLENGYPCACIDLFLRMGEDGVDRDGTTVAVILKSCSSIEDYRLGVQVHALSVTMGFDRDVVVGSALVDMYSKCRCLESSVWLFREMPDRNNVSWGAIIAGCVQNQHLEDGLELFLEMRREGVAVSQSVYASILRSCAGLSSLKLGRQVHGHAVKNDFDLDIIVGTAILDMYAKCGALRDAKGVFQSLPARNVQSWNAMVVGLVRNDLCLEALKLFQLMHRDDVALSEISLSGAFSACAGSGRYLEGLQVHGFAIKRNLDSTISVANAALDMYAKCRALAEACRIFDDMDRRDAVSWNAMIAALEQNGKYEHAFPHYDQMLYYGMEPDEFTFGSILKACGALQSLGCGLKVHNRIIKFGMGLDPFIGSSLVDTYCKCGYMDEAEKLHERLEQQTIVSWNAMISGFSAQKQSEESQIFFSRMLDMGVKPDNFTYATVLDTCANLATVELGKQIHAQIIKQQLHKDVYISSTLVDMYSKCGNMQDSLLMFEKMPERDCVSWNALISGYAQHGLGGKAINIFERMRMENIKPNHATFVSVLRACGHIGMFGEGINYFHSMLHDYGLEPQMEHYSCMVDILGRAGHVHEALKLIEDMPFGADATTWRTLLSICQIHRNMDVAEVAANSILQLEPDDSSAYILLSNIYAESEKWEEVSKMRRMMRQNKLKKEPGCSWIQVKNEVHAFLVGDKAHPRCAKIYERLNLLVSEIRRDRFISDMDLIYIDNGNEYEDDQEQFRIGCG